MTLLIVKNAASNAISVFNASEEQVEAFNQSDDLPVAIMGWPVYTPDDLAETSLYADDLVELYKTANPSVKEIPGEPSKRQLANIVFGSVSRLAQPYKLTGTIKACPVEEQKQPVKRPRRTNATRREPSEELKQCTAGTKQALLVDVFKKWATPEEGAEVVGWKPASIKSGIDYDLCTLKGYGWEKREQNGVTQYRLLYPEGHNGPLEHKVRK